MTDTTVTPTPTNTPTPIHTPTPTNTPVPTLPSEVEIELKVTGWDGGKSKVDDQIHLYDYQWKVLDTITVQLKVTGPSGFDPTGYAFQASFPKSTGLQNGDSDDADCDWDLFEADPEYHIYTTASISNNGTWDFVRCGLGEPSSRLTVTATAPDGTSIPTNVNLPIPEAWHHNDNTLRYRICGDPTVPSTTPDFEEAVHHGRGMWNAAGANLTFLKLVDPECDEPLDPIRPVTITWADDGQTDSMCKDTRATGCARDTEGTASFYPHFGSQTIFIRNNLRRWDRHWTNLISFVGEVFRYLPATLAHEIGHTAGLGHAPWNSDRIMAPGDKPTSLQSEDIDAMSAIYQGHENHEAN